MARHTSSTEEQQLNLFPELEPISDLKPEYHHIPAWILQEIALCLTFGAKKHSPYGWLTDEGELNFLDKLDRHVNSYKLGHNLDPETQLEHLTHAICNLIMELDRKRKRGYKSITN